MWGIRKYYDIKSMGVLTRKIKMKELNFNMIVTCSFNERFSCAVHSRYSYILSSSVFATDDGCWSSETCIAKLLRLCMELFHWFIFQYNNINEHLKRWNPLLSCKLTFDHEVGRHTTNISLRFTEKFVATPSFLCGL